MTSLAINKQFILEIGKDIEILKWVTAILFSETD